MKSRTLTCITAMTLFATLAMALRLAAQEKENGHARYKLIDLGTFGGQASYLSNVFDGIQNHRGAIVGWADVAKADPDPTFCFNFDCFVSHAFQWQDGNLTDLGALVRGWSSAALWTNEAGQVVGIAENGMIDPLIGFPEFRAALWQNGGITDLGTLEGDMRASPTLSTTADRSRDSRRTQCLIPTLSFRFPGLRSRTHFCGRTAR